MKVLPTIEIDENGDLQCLYADDLCLQDIGLIHNMHRASKIKFDEHSQMFNVISAKTGEIVYSTPKRELAIEWEIENFSIGGKYYENN